MSVKHAILNRHSFVPVLVLLLISTSWFVHPIIHPDMDHADCPLHHALFMVVVLSTEILAIVLFLFHEGSLPLSIVFPKAAEFLATLQSRAPPCFS